MLLVLAAAAFPSQTQTFTTLHTFDNTDGRTPLTMIQGNDGQLYATTLWGGTDVVDCVGGCGTIFKINPSGKFTTLLSLDGSDGSYPGGAPLFQATNSEFYGVITNGGANLVDCIYGCGTAFSFSSTGMLTTLYNFCSQPGCTDGSVPYGGLLQLADGNFYGTTSAGGSNNASCAGGCGTVFKVTPRGALTTLYNFCSQDGCADGSSPFAGLIQATDGNLYGTTATGGASGYGTIFRITPTGELTTLHTFVGTDGGYSGWPLIQATDGNLYSATASGGSFGYGTFFKLSLSGELTTLHNFDKVDGVGPFPPIQASDGNFYGVTNSGGANNDGTIFRITRTGKLSTLYSFCAQSGCADGVNPGPLLQDTNGTFYGPGSAGGNYNLCTGGCGTIFFCWPGAIRRDSTHFRQSRGNSEDSGNQADRRHERHVQRHSGRLQSDLG